MTPRPVLAVLCYHRIVADERVASAWPYFLRGTAVRTSTFDRHLADLRRRCTVVNEATAIEILYGRSAPPPRACWVTFDDGYEDVRREAAPRMDGLPGTVFMTADTLRNPGRGLPADRWFAALLTARRRHGNFTASDGSQRAFDLDDPEDRRRFVDGPERRAFLRSPFAVQDATMSSLATALESLPTDLRGEYLDAPALRELSTRGLSVGSHGATHALFGELSAAEILSELRALDHTLQSFGFAARPRSLAYPNGEASPAAKDAAREHGFELALRLGGAACSAAQDVFAVPRLVASDAPEWISSHVAATFE